jgi:hypothetical protein
MSHKDTVSSSKTLSEIVSKIGASLTISLVIPVNAKIAAGISFQGL